MIQDQQRHRPESGAEADDQRRRADQLGPGGKHPADVDRHHAERKRKVALDVGKPVFAAQFFQSGDAEFISQQQADAEQADPGPLIESVQAARDAGGNADSWCAPGNKG
jgi:hypothetical protein